MLQTALSFETARATRDFFTKNWHISAIFAAGFLMLFGLLTTAKAQSPRPSGCFTEKVFKTVINKYDAELVAGATARPDGTGGVMEIWAGTDPDAKGIDGKPSRRVWVMTRHKQGGAVSYCLYLTGFNYSGDVPAPSKNKGKGPKIEG